MSNKIKLKRGLKTMICNTAEKCPKTGLWKCVVCGAIISLTEKSIFPLCKNCGFTAWKLVLEETNK